MPTKYETLLQHVNKIHDIEKATGLLMWDREVIMPKAGNDMRVHQITTLRKLHHELFTSDQTGELIEEAAQEVADMPYDSIPASLVRYLRDEYADSRKLPAEFVARVAGISGQANPVWVAARANNDFASFQPWLEQIVVLGQEMAELYGYEDEKYDALLDKFEKGMKTADVRAIFDAQKQETRPLLEAIQERGRPVDDSVVHQAFDIEQQKAFAQYIAPKVGYDFDRGYLGTAVHPFASSFSRWDARITTRWYPNFLNPSLFGTLHESGHAIYEQGTHPDLARTPLARGTSSGIHESQSRMMENIVGRSWGFWQAHYGALQAHFPAQLSNVTARDFFRAVNKVMPSLIRVEADELTYNMHIILRFELEQALINGELAVTDLPAAWNAGIESLLGITPPTDREGVLQDIHWSRPSFGYFPTYALGNLYAAQLWEAALQQEPAIGAQLAVGDTAGLLAWLGKNIHQHGRKFTPSELIVRATGRPLSHTPFVRYVHQKFSDVYEL